MSTDRGADSGSETESDDELMKIKAEPQAQTEEVGSSMAGNEPRQPQTWNNVMQLLSLPEANEGFVSPFARLRTEQSEPQEPTSSASCESCRTSPAASVESEAPEAIQHEKPIVDKEYQASTPVDRGPVSSNADQLPHTDYSSSPESSTVRAANPVDHVSTARSPDEITGSIARPHLMVKTSGVHIEPPPETDGTHPIAAELSLRLPVERRESQSRSAQNESRNAEVTDASSSPTQRTQEVSTDMVTKSIEAQAPRKPKTSVHKKSTCISGRKSKSPTKRTRVNSRSDSKQSSKQPQQLETNTTIFLPLKDIGMILAQQGFPVVRASSSGPPYVRQPASFCPSGSFGDVRVASPPDPSKTAYVHMSIAAGASSTFSYLHNLNSPTKRTRESTQSGDQQLSKRPQQAYGLMQAVSPIRYSSVPPQQTFMRAGGPTPAQQAPPFFSAPSAGLYFAQQPAHAYGFPQAAPRAYFASSPPPPSSSTFIHTPQAFAWHSISDVQVSSPPTMNYSSKSAGEGIAAATNNGSVCSDGHELMSPTERTRDSTRSSDLQTSSQPQHLMTHVPMTGSVGAIGPMPTQQAPPVFNSPFTGTYYAQQPLESYGYPPAASRSQPYWTYAPRGYPVVPTNGMRCLCYPGGRPTRPVASTTTSIPTKAPTPPPIGDFLDAL